MAKAYKCDRCGKFYEIFGGDECLCRTVVILGYHQGWEHKLDLCQVCHNEFTEWLSSTGCIKKENL